MPYADNDATRNHYDVQGNGPPMVLLHDSQWSIEGRTTGS